MEDRQNNQPEAGGIGADVAEKDASQQGEAMSQEEVAAEFGKATDVLGESVTENIARIAHEVNRAYREAIGEETGPHWNLAPVWQRNSCMDGVRFHVANPDASVAASHEEWLKYKQAAGWAYGPVKDEDEKLHPCVKSFYELPKEQQVKDYLFRAVVHAMRD